MALRFRGLDAPIEVVYRKSSGSAPQPVDPYQQAAAQYGLATGTAEFNAGLNRTNTVNPAGSSTWTNTGSPTGSSGMGGGGAPVQNSGTMSPNDPVMSHYGTSSPGYSPNPISAAGLQNNTGGAPSQYNTDVYGSPGGSSPSIGGLQVGQGAPTYTQTTSLQPWANAALSHPVDTSGIAGMPGGPSTTQDLYNTQHSLYNQQEAYIQPQQQLANEQLQSQLANQGITPGSAAYNNAMDTQNRANTFTNNQALNSAIQGGGAEQSRLFGLGSQSLQNQIAVRDLPINEYNSLNGAAGATANANAPDISGAFAQQYQGKLAGYNAGVATDNANTQAGVDLASMAALAYLFA